MHDAHLVLFDDFEKKNIFEDTHIGISGPKISSKQLVILAVSNEFEQNIY
jgi:hypothetical protein